MRSSVRQRGAQETLRLGLLRYGREGLHTPPRRARRRAASRRGRRSAREIDPRARGIRRRSAPGTRLLRARVGRGRRWMRAGTVAGIEVEQEEVRSGSRPPTAARLSSRTPVEPEVAADALIRDGRVDVAIADHRRRHARAPAGSPRRRAGRARRRRAAPPPTGRRGRRGGRGCESPRRAPFRPARASTGRRLRRPRAAAQRSSACVDLPEPSRPSKVTNIGSILRPLHRMRPCGRS